MSSDPQTPLLPNETEFTAMAKEALGYIKKDIYHFKDNPNARQTGTGHKWIHSNDNQELQQQLTVYHKFQEEIPSKPSDFSSLLESYFDNIHVSTQDNQNGYMCFCPGGGLPTAAIGEFIASATNRSSTMFNVFPMGASIEDSLVKWFSQIIGAPFHSTHSGGYLTSGGSMANLMAMDMMRDAFMNNNANANINDLIVYCNEQSHYSVEQSVKFIGIPVKNLRTIESDRFGKMKNEALIAAIESDLKKGLKPVCCIATAGVTQTGAVDDLRHISGICKEYNLWFHVDAAMAGFYYLTERGKRYLDGLQLCDSLTLDPHKSLFMPYGIGALLVKDVKKLQSANRFSSACMHHTYDTCNSSIAMPADLCDLSFELTRSFRGLGPWLALKTLGFDKITQELDKNMDLIEFVAKYIGEMKYVQIMTVSQLPILTFKLNLVQIAKDVGVNKHFYDCKVDELNKQFLDCINSKGNIILSAAKSVQKKQGQFAVRIIINSFRTQKSDIIQALNDVELSAQEMYHLFEQECVC